MQSRSSAAGQLHSTDHHQPAAPAKKSGTAPHVMRSCTPAAGIPMAAAGGFRLAAAAEAVDQEGQQHFQLQVLDHFLDKLLNIVPRRKRSCKTKLQKVLEIETLGMMMTLPKAAATVDSTLTTTVTKPQDSTKSCGRYVHFFFTWLHQQHALLRKINQLLLPAYLLFKFHSSSGTIMPTDSQIFYCMIIDIF
jgi:hypothetical protein